MNIARHAVVHGYMACCFVCGAPACCFTGHIHVGDEIIGLGWCMEHQRTAKTSKPPAEPYCIGCYGLLTLESSL